MFADIERACAVLGYNPDGKDLWQVACALGIHLADDTGPSGLVIDDTLKEMLAAQKAYEQGGPEPQWGQPI